MMMATRRIAHWIVLLGGLGSALTAARSQPTAETWIPASRGTQAVTGKVSFAPTLITFQNGKSAALARGGQMLFRPEKKARKVMADLYRVAVPEDLVLENGSSLCKGKPARFLIVWRSEKLGNETDPRTMAVFAGQRFDPGSPDECGRYLYDAGTR